MHIPQRTVLLIGGTSETSRLAESLAEAGLGVLVSLAGNTPLDVGTHPRIRKRVGPLDEALMEGLVNDRHVSCIVDAAHPYASQVHLTSRTVAVRLGLPYFRWVREESVIEDAPLIRFADDHEDAATLAASMGHSVLLTTGSRNLIPYARECARAGISLAARVLPDEDSVMACSIASIPQEKIITGRGPFSLDENLAAIRQYGIDVLVTKDGGPAGGVPEKLKAAEISGCKVVVIRRPVLPSDNEYGDIGTLVGEVCRASIGPGNGIEGDGGCAKVEEKGSFI
ncbi:MAG: precorrin-6A reductase [Pseudomonadota bacterium]